MARQRRKESYSNIYHVMLRGVNRQQIFYDEEDNLKFVYLLKRYKISSGFTLYAYCLMGNHVHLLLRVNEEPLDQVVKRIGCAFAHWYNEKYERTGHLFQDRFESEPVDDRGYFLTVLRYIIWNPVKAGMVDSPENYVFGSGKEYIYNKPKITDIRPVQNAVGQSELKEYLLTRANDKCLENEKTRKRYTDEIAKEMIVKEFGKLMPDFEQTKDEERFNQSIQRLKEAGVSLRQLCRLTGISRRQIEKAIKAN